MIVHTACLYNSKNAMDNRRMARAAATWRLPGLVDACCRDSDLVRSGLDVGDSKRMPFLRDVVDWGFRGQEVNTVVLTNADSMLVSDAMEYIQPAVAGCGYAGRRDVYKEFSVQLSLHESMKRCDPFIGHDLFVISRSWWQDNKSGVPDLLMGYEGWDWCLKYVMGVQFKLPDLVYHTHHQYPHWYRNRLQAPGNLYNRSECKKWAITRPNYAVMCAEWRPLAEYRILES
jgi:hypothetical protein